MTLRLLGLHSCINTSAFKRSDSMSDRKFLSYYKILYMSIYCHRFHDWAIWYERMMPTNFVLHRGRVEVTFSFCRSTCQLISRLTHHYHNYVICRVQCLIFVAWICEFHILLCERLSMLSFPSMSSYDFSGRRWVSLGAFLCTSYFR